VTSLRPDTLGDVLTFTPRPKPAAPIRSEPAQTALDAADRIIAVLDRMDGDAHREDGGDAEPSLAAPENQGSQVTWLRGTDQDREAEVPEPVLPEVAVEPIGLPWRDRGNVIAAAGSLLIELLERA